MKRSTRHAEDYWFRELNHESENIRKLDSEAKSGVVMRRETSHTAAESRSGGWRLSARD